MAIDGELQSYPVPNLVQGVSQQTSEQRRETQCEAQFDCLNRPVNGVEARPPVEVLRTLPGLNFSHAHCHELVHADENYVAIFTPNNGSPKVRVYDLVTGETCAVTFTANQNYLSTDGDPREVFRSATLEDYTFVSNKNIKPRMDPAVLAPNDNNEGLIFFRAGGYKIRYRVKVTLRTAPGNPSAAGKVYVFTYQTPDNSDSGNARYITTSQLASTFYKAFTGTTAPSAASGDTAVDSVAGTAEGGNVAAGTDPEEKQPLSATTSLTSIGFYCKILGNVILIGRTDGGVFVIDTTDGAGDTHLRCAKGQVQDFNDLPDKTFVGFTIKVKGTNRETDDDYWVEYKAADGGSGYWEECAKPGVKITLEASLMLHALVNVGYQEFEWLRPDWGDRVSGDGETKSKDPSFVGKRIEDLFYSHNRLGILTEASIIWSKTRNPFVFFQTSAQTTLDTDPVDVEVGGGDFIAILSRVVRTQDTTFIWADGIQFRVEKGDQTGGFSAKTVDIPESSAYDFTPKARPKSVGKSVYFVSEPGEFCVVRDILYREGKLIGETDVTAHVPKYIPKGIRIVTASDHLGMLFMHTERTPNLLYVYNFLLGDNERLQSAWNIWRLPEDCEVVWAGVRENRLNMVIQRPGAALLCRVDLSVDLTDPQEVLGIQTKNRPDYLTRVDLRITDGQLIHVAYDAITDKTRLILPFKVPEARGDTSSMFVVTRETDANRGEANEDWNSRRGYEWSISSIAWNAILEKDVITVSGDARKTPLYIGFRITAERTESEFHVRGSTGVLDVEALVVHEHIYSLAKTGYTRAEIVEAQYNARRPKYEYQGRSIPGIVDDAVVALGDTKFKVAVNKNSNEYSLKLVNDSWLPSRWTALKVHYVAATVARSVAGVGSSRSRG